ncbi:hypothetical protein C0991_003983 [Blastosporella zonata]|nr:hypothetical protein C0991_003983 [Blastosporella zonata]
MSVCQSLSPPPPTPSRHRASSTTARPFPVNSLGRRRSNSSLQLTPPETPAPPPTPNPPLDPITTAVQPPSMLVLVASRLLQWFHLQPNQHLTWSTPSSPRTSGEDFVLPLSASAAKSPFETEQKQQPPTRDRFFAVRSFPSPPAYLVLTPRVLQQHASIILVVLMFPVSTALVLLCLYTLPISLAWPHTIADVAQLGRELHGYTQSGTGPVAHVIGVMAITAIWKHAWSVPGSVIWNVLAGALFSPAYATVLLTTLTMLGSACATLLAMPLAPFLTHFFPRALDMTRSALEGGSEGGETESGKPRSPAWIGDILQTVASTPSPTPQSISSLLTTPDIILKLIFLSFLSLAPILGRDHLRSLISSPRPLSTDEKTKWAWVQQWRTRLRSKSQLRAQQREQSLKELAVLVQEKRTLELPS